MIYTVLPSPLGPLLALREGVCLVGLYLPTGKRPQQVEPTWTPAEPDDVLFADLAAQLDEYFAGDRLDFDLALNPQGTTFQRRVWDALRAIPYAETRTYGQTAAAIGAPDAARAVGLANGQNPISIIVPCHRVIGADGSLTGYGGGLDAKRWLLGHELAHSGATLPLG